MKRSTKCPHGGLNRLEVRASRPWRAVRKPGLPGTVRPTPKPPIQGERTSKGKRMKYGKDRYSLV